MVLLTTRITQQCAVPGGNIKQSQQDCIHSRIAGVSSEKILLDSVLFKLHTYIHTYIFTSIYPFTGNSSQGCRDSHNKYRHRMSVELQMS